MPWASSHRRCPNDPRRARSISSPRARTSPTVWMPSSFSTASVALPTPGIFPTGSGIRNASTCDGLITKSPSGFFQSDAIFARNLLGATPADAVRSVSSRISRRIILPVSVAVGSPVSSCVTSRNASSSESNSTSGVWRRKMSPIWRDTARYRSKSGGTKTPSGQSCCARNAESRTGHRTSAPRTTPRRPRSSGPPRRRSPACLEVPADRAARPTRRTRPCRRG